MRYFLLLASTLLFIQSCDKSSTNVPIQTRARQTIVADADTLFIQQDKSIITWIGSKPTAKHNGIIKLKGGFLLVRDTEILGGEVSIDVTSIQVMDLSPKEENYEKLQSHLKSVDFFDVAKYPGGRFELTSIVAYDSLNHFPADKQQLKLLKNRPESPEVFLVPHPSHFIEGNLTLKGIQKPIAFPAKIAINHQFITIEAQFNIDRTDWEITYSSEANVIDKAKDKFIYNIVNVGCYLRANLTESNENI